MSPAISGMFLLGERALEVEPELVVDYPVPPPLLIESVADHVTAFDVAGESETLVRRKLQITAPFGIESSAFAQLQPDRAAPAAGDEERQYE